MAASNPSHLLISRNPRSPAHPQLAGPPAHAAHAGPAAPPAHRRSRSVPSLAAAVERERGGAPHSPPVSNHGDEDDEEAETDIEVESTFRADAPLRGSVKVIVGRHAFWCHREVLWFASPFFRALLEGDWAETEPVSSPTDTDVPPATEPEPPSTAHSSDAPEHAGSDAAGSDTPGSETSGGPSKPTSVYLDAEGPGMAEILRELRELPDGRDLERHGCQPATHAAPGGGSAPPSALADAPAPPRTPTTPVLPALLTLPSSLPLPPAVTPQWADESAAGAVDWRAPSRPPPRARHALTVDRGERARGVDAVVELKEEDAGAFQDFLFWAYPHLDCRVSWTNVEPLLALASKLLVPPLQALCVRFLLTHASGRPVVALALAERHEHAELYREASRFVLDQATWDDAELSTVSERTRLQLSLRRTWFLERLLKLNTVDAATAYTCRADCAAPAACAGALAAKLRQALAAVVGRFGPPRPSVAFRCVRQLDAFPTSPALCLPSALCQRAAQVWVASLFDRMFAPRLTGAALSPGTEKYWLYITLD